jgi:hypothetical protein
MCPACMTTIALTAGGATTPGGVLTLVFRNPLARICRRIARKVTGAVGESSVNRNSERRP